MDTSYHNRRSAERRVDPEFEREYLLARSQIDQVDRIIRPLDQLRQQLGMPKSELARRIGKNPAAVRRLLSAEANPKLKTITAIAAALGAEVTIAPSEPG